ncbi:MAG: hypothetical protein EA383_16350 [Spirochaetaceae bacterium]|nr:MAG: hypothetical protein EA383_16350 [Spirochaetaceae bacterium]
MKSRLHVLAASVSGAFVTLVVVYAWAAAVASPTHFPDERLEAAVRNALEGVGRTFTPTELERITELDAEAFGITSLEGIEQLANLAVLNLRGNRVADVSPLTALSRLQHLSLRDNDITDLEAVNLGVLAALPELRSLDLRHNRGPSHPESPDDHDRISDISVLAEFVRLEVLDLADNHVADITALSGLTRLRHLDLRYNQLGLADLAPVAPLTQLEYLNLRETGTTDLTGIQELRNLGYLNLHSNSDVASIEPIAGLPRLHTLILRGVPVGREIDVIETLPALRRLNLRETGVTDLTPLARLMERGALQDDPERGVFAEIDIRENPVHLRGDPDGYQVLEPYWENIARRDPQLLPPPLSRDVVISEVMSSNGSTIDDGAGNYPDWIELHNRGDNSVDLSGYYLSDHADRSTRWRFPDGAGIAARGYLLVWASGRDFGTTDGTGPDGRFHASFRLSSDGEAVILTAPDGRTRVDAVSIPPLPRDVSYGLSDTNGQLHVTFSQPTPEAANDDAFEYRRLVFSHAQGFHSAGFDLEIAARTEFDDRETSIYYTLDGSVPDPAAVDEPRSYQVMNYEVDELEAWEERTYRYDVPIRVRTDTEAAYTIADSLAGLPRIVDIDTTSPNAEFWDWHPPRSDTVRATVVRAAAFARDPNAGGEYRRVSQVESATYIVTPQGQDRFSLPTISIITPPSGLFDYDDGIYVAGRIYDDNLPYERTWMAQEANYSQRWERPAHLTFFEPEAREPVFSIDAGVRIHGSFSRSQPLKTLRLYARKDYDVTNYFEHAFFTGATRRDGSGEPVERYKRLLLRSGQSLFRSHLQDAVIQHHLIDHLNVDMLRYRPVVHFVNGEYWGIKNLRERFDRFYLESNYGFDPDEVIVVEGPFGFDWQLDEGLPGENRPYFELVRFIEDSDMSEAANYEQIHSQMDVLSFIDYNIIRIYSGDRDGVNKHVAVWRQRGDYDPDAEPGYDRRWRWHTWDLDNAFMDQHNTMEFYANDGFDVEEEMLEDAGSVSDADYDYDYDYDGAEPRRSRDPAYTAMIVSLFASDEFRSLFLNRFAGLLNTVFQPDEMNASIDRAEALLEPEIAEHIERWGHPFSVDAWRAHVLSHRDFVAERVDVQREHILEYFQRRGYDLPGTYVLQTGSRQPEGGYVRVALVDVDSSTPGVTDRSSWQGVWFAGSPLELEAVPEPGYRFAAWHGDLDAAVGAAAAGDAVARERRLTIEPTGDVEVFASFERVGN